MSGLNRSRQPESGGPLPANNYSAFTGRLVKAGLAEKTEQIEYRDYCNDFAKRLSLKINLVLDPHILKAFVMR